MPAVAGAVPEVYVRGIVRDSLSMTGLPYASVLVEGTPKAIVADEKGLFEMKVPRAAWALKATCMGYESRTLPLRPDGLNIYDFQLPPAATELKELVVSKKKYSKKNNPAVASGPPPPKPTPRRNPATITTNTSA